MADEADSKSAVREGVWVRVPPPALNLRSVRILERAKRPGICADFLRFRRLAGRGRRQGTFLCLLFLKQKGDTETSPVSEPPPVSNLILIKKR